MQDIQFVESQILRRHRLPIVPTTERNPLAEELARHLRGEVRFDPGARALYATDASNYRQVPLGVVLPRGPEDVMAALAICRLHRAPVVGRGGGTSLAGQGCNTAVVFDFSKYMNGILSIDPERRSAWVEPGVVLDELRNRAEEFGLTFGPDPATHTHCTLGGMIGNNSCGVHSMMAGCTADNVEALEIATYDGARFTVGPTPWSELEALGRREGREGEIHRAVATFVRKHEAAIREGFPRIPRRVSGYNLPALLDPEGPQLAQALVGSESTLVTILSARVRLVPSPPCRVLVVLGYPSIFEAADHIMEVRESEPIGLEGIDEILVADMKEKGLHPERVDLLPPGKGWLLVEFGGHTRNEALEKARALKSRLAATTNPPSVKIFHDPGEEAIVWKVRESGLGATARVPGRADTWEGWEDSSVPPEALGSYLRAFRGLLDRYGYRAALYGHFGQGCLHTRIPFDLRSPSGIAKFRSFVEEAADLVVSHGGSLSGEHGDGQSRAELLPKMFGPELIRAFEEWKAIWDPEGGMNPGKIVRPNRLDEDLRLGPEYHPKKLPTRFAFPEDEGSFSYAAERCVGVGECRKTESGVMCPSYMVTGEEMHSTRGRARLLFEMVRGDALAGVWKNEAVKEALDLCLSCKGCKGECPVNVDMATYKAEFLSHYYEGRLRPRSAYAFGWMHRWARLASWLPGPVNWIARAPVLSRWMKRAIGVEERRSIPPFAPFTFQEWWKDRPAQQETTRPAVLLWADTWGNHFEPEIPISAVHVLEDAGYRVTVPRKRLCCGRPLYDHGMLDLAKRLLGEVLEALRPALRAGIPIVGLEPSCISVFREELPQFFPDDPDAKRLRENAFLLSDFLLHRTKGWEAPPLEGKAVVQGHCHHQSVLGFKEDVPLYARMGLAAEILDAGCCGMAGAFGYERERYPVSVACAERVLAPAVRRASEETWIVADGFSCRGQIEQQTGRHALHTAELLRMASRGEAPFRAADLPLPKARRRKKLGLFLAGVGALYLLSRRPR